MDENVPFLNQNEVSLTMTSPTQSPQQLHNVYIDPEFEKEALNFKIESDSSNEIKAVHSAIEKITSNLLYNWINVPIVFPDSIVEQGYSEQFTGSVDSSLVKNLFLLPTFDELEEISVDSSGQRKKLTKDQLESIKKNGSFEVPSANFPDKYHKWKLAKWLQKGSTKTNSSFLNDISNALSLIIITARNRFISKRFSISSGFKACGDSIYQLVDILIGLPQKHTDKYKSLQKVQEELEKFLVGDLLPEASEVDKFNNACKQMIEIIKDRSKAEKQLNLPNYYRTSEGLLIDLRLSDSIFVNEIRPILKDLLKNTTKQKQKLNYLRQNYIKELREGSHTNEEIEKRTNKYLIEHYLKDLYQSILENSQLENISPGIGRMLCEHAQAGIIMHEEQNRLNLEMKNHIDTFSEKLKKKNKVKSLISEWLVEHETAERKRFISMNMFTAHTRSIDKCHEMNLSQAAYFIEREIDFVKKVTFWVKIDIFVNFQFFNLKEKRYNFKGAK